MLWRSGVTQFTDNGKLLSHAWARDTTFRWVFPWKMGIAEMPALVSDIGRVLSCEMLIGPGPKRSPLLRWKSRCCGGRGTGANRIRVLRTLRRRWTEP